MPQRKFSAALPAAATMAVGVAPRPDIAECQMADSSPAQIVAGALMDCLELDGDEARDAARAAIGALVAAGFQIMPAEVVPDDQ